LQIQWKAKKPFTQVYLLVTFLIVVVGPIAHTVSDLRFFFQTILQAEPWFSDPKCLEIPWRTEQVALVKDRPLTFGLVKWDHLIMPHPPVQRGIKIVAEALKAQGHEIIDFEIPDPQEADNLTVLSLHFLVNMVGAYLCSGRREGYP
jgi:Asp-tRNA(Asn)/Glu-tRNA(Gln) amidotransferase A subunit family amidase